MPRPKKRKGMTAEIALSLISKVLDVQKQYPVMARKIDELQMSILDAMKAMRKEVEILSDRERDVYTVSIINFIHEKADETLLD